MLIILFTLNYIPVFPRVPVHECKQLIAMYTADVLPDHPKKLQFNPQLNRNSSTEKNYRNITYVSGWLFPTNWCKELWDMILLPLILNYCGFRGLQRAVCCVLLSLFPRAHRLALLVSCSTAWNNAGSFCSNYTTSLRQKPIKVKLPTAYSVRSILIRLSICFIICFQNCFTT